MWEGNASPGFKQIQVALEQNQNDMYIHWYSDTIPNAGSGTTSRPNSRIYLTNESAPVGRNARFQTWVRNLILKQHSIILLFQQLQVKVL